MTEPHNDRNSAGLWQEVRRRLRAFVIKRVPSDAEAEDILQTVFLRLHEQSRRGRDPSQVLPWLFKTARNAIADYYRSPERRASPVGNEIDTEQNKVGFSSDFEKPDDARTELAACLHPMLERLSPNYREAVTLVELEGLTQKKAAERLGISLSGMKSRVQRGRQQLKQVLDECCLIQLDRRNMVTGFERRKGKCGGCQ